MQELIIEVMNRFGYIGITFLIALENIIPPIPSEVILTFSGFMTTCTSMHAIGVILFATVGSVAGAIVLYWIGTLLTPERLERLFDTKVFKLLGFKKGDVMKTVNSFEHYGRKAILFGRCIPIIRSLISIPAGMARISLPLFIFYTTIGSLVWNIVLVYLGAFMGESWEMILCYLDTYSVLVVRALKIAVVIACLIFIKKRIFTKKKESGI